MMKRRVSGAASSRKFAGMILGLCFLGLMALAVYPAPSTAARQFVHDLGDEFDPDEFDGVNSIEMDAYGDVHDEGDEYETEEEDGLEDGYDVEDAPDDDDNDDDDDDDDDEHQTASGDADGEDYDEFEEVESSRSRGRRSGRRGSSRRTSSTKKSSPQNKRRVSRKRARGRAAAAKAEAAASAARDQAQVPVAPRTYVAETVCIGIILLYAVVYFGGSAMNERIATAWADEFHSLMSEQFAEVGEQPAADDQRVRPRNLLTKESQNLFRLYATGRQNCRGVIIDLELQPRQDLFYLLYGLFFGSEDHVRIEVPMDDGAMHPFVLAVLPVKEATRIVSESEDLKNFAREIKAARTYLPDSMTMHSDAPYGEVMPLLPPKQYFEEHKELFHSMHFTDQNIAARSSSAGVISLKSLKFCFRLPTGAGQMSRLAPLMKIAIAGFIDKVAAFKLSSKAKERAMKYRRKAKSQLFREGQESREERIRLRQEEKFKEEKRKKEKMTPQQLQKYEARQEELRRKRRMKKMSKSTIRVAM